MKRIFILYVMLIVTTVTANAQFFVEGSLGVSYRGESSTLDGVTKETPSHSLGVSPLAGYRLNEKTALGVRASLYGGTQKFLISESDTGEEMVLERKTPRWDVGVFNRYQLWGAKKFSLLLESSFYMSGLKRFEKHGATIIQDEAHSSFGIRALPLMMFDLSDRFSLITSCDFLSFELYHLVSKNRNTGLKKRSSHFGFNAQSDVYGLGEIRIGIIYHFKKSAK